MRAAVLSVLGILLVATGSGSAAHAAWQDAVPVSGSTLSTVTPAAPDVSCLPLSLLLLRISWAPVPQATHYVVSYGVTGTETVETQDASVTYKDLSVLAAGSLTVQARFGSTDWLSAPSNSVEYAVVLAAAVCV